VLGDKNSEGVVFYTPVDEIFPISFSLGTGTTYIDYAETLRNVQLTELVLTGKASLDIRFSPGIDVSASGYTTLAPLEFKNASSANLPDAYFTGLNGRIGWRLPNSTGSSDLRLLTGWYYWSMRVKNNAYGVTDLQGPQIYVMGRQLQKRHRTFYGYFKFAPIYDYPKYITISNREIAMGFGYQINNPRESLTWSLYTDVSDARFRSVQQGNSMRLFTVTFGVQFMI
jgi:hypothetical protein